LLFDPPVTEFSVLQVMIGMNGTEIHRAIDGPSIAIVTNGQGKASCGKEQLELSVGQVVFIGAGTEVTLTSEQGLVIYRAFVEVRERK
jgi:mannose-6-phosphate isomerase